MDYYLVIGHGDDPSGLVSYIEDKHVAMN